MCLQFTHSFTHFLSCHFPVDIGPLSPGHALVIPKYHAAKLHELPDDHLAELLPVAKKLAIATGAENYNILQNNGRPAHQVSKRRARESKKPAVEMSKDTIDR